MYTSFCERGKDPHLLQNIIIRFCQVVEFIGAWIFIIYLLSKCHEYLKNFCRLVSASSKVVSRAPLEV